MRHYRQPPKKSFFAYMVPFLILVIIATIIFFLFKFGNNLKSRFSLESSYATMQTLEGEAKVLLWNTEKWKSVPQSQIKLFKGDSIRALPGSKVKLELFNKHTIMLNGGAELTIKELSKKNNATYISLILTQGEAWFNVLREINPNATFLVKAGNLDVSTRSASFDLEPDVIRVTQGQADVAIILGGEKTKEIMVGVGQELVLNEERLVAIQKQDNSIELLGMIADEFKLSDWYKFNLGEKTPLNLNTEENSNLTQTATGGNLNTTGSVLLEETTKANAFILTKPEITYPIQNGEEFTLTEPKQTIKGTVLKGTTKVEVNGYILKSFKEGDTNWHYNADIKYGNLKEGKNIYKVYALDSIGNKSKPAEITLIYGNITETETEKTESINLNPATEQTPATEENSTNSPFAILEPNGGTDFTTTETHFVFKGTAPPQTAKIIVATYTLQNFKPGDTTWKYVTDTQYNNIFVGEDNTYKATAYDKDNNILGETSITITVKEALSSTGQTLE